MNKRYRLCDVEEAVSEMDELIEVDDDIAEIDDDMQLVISGWSVYIESLNITLRQGVACIWDEEEGLFMPDFDVTIVYEGNIETQGKPIYQDVCYPVTKEFREKLYNEIISEYEKAKEKNNEKAREDAKKQAESPERDRKETPFR